MKTVLRVALLGAVALSLTACAGRDREELAYVEQPVETLYAEAFDKMQRRRYDEAAAYFDEVERQHPYSPWARRAQLMSAFSYYVSRDYAKSIQSAQRFLPCLGTLDPRFTAVEGRDVFSGNAWKVRSSVLMLVLLHDETAESEWCRKEWLMAKQHGVPIVSIFNQDEYSLREIRAMIASYRTTVPAVDESADDANACGEAGDGAKESECSGKEPSPVDSSTKLE